MDNLLCILFESHNYKVTMEKESEKISRIAVYDSDGKYIEDWSYDNGDNIGNMIEDILKCCNLGTEKMVQLLSDCFGFSVIDNPTLEQYANYIEKYNTYHVNRIGKYLLIYTD